MQTVVGCKAWNENAFNSISFTFNSNVHNVVCCNFSIKIPFWDVVNTHVQNGCFKRFFWILQNRLNVMNKIICWRTWKTSTNNLMFIPLGILSTKTTFFFAFLILKLLCKNPGQKLTSLREIEIVCCDFSCVVATVVG